MEVSTVAIIIMGCTLFLYITELIPLSVTSMLSCIAMGIFGCYTKSTPFSGFANDVTMLVIGTCIVGDTLFHTGAATFVGSKLIRLFGRSEKLFLLASIVLAASLSAFLSNSATVAMMLPMMGSVIANSGGKLKKKYTYMPIGFAAVAGGSATIIGSTPQVVAQGMLKEHALQEVSFFEYMLTGAPKVVIMVIFFMTIGNTLLHRVCDFPEREDTDVKDNDRTFTPQMLISILILAVCVLLFVLQSVFGWDFLTIGTISMLGAAMCILTRCISAKEALQRLDWNTIFLLAFALGMAAGLNESGAGQVIANSIVNLVGNNVNPFLIMAAFALLASFLGNLISTTASVSMLGPICLSLAPAVGMDPRSLLIAVVTFASVVYCTPTSTPPNSMPLVAGYRFMDYVKVGGLLNVITVVLLLLLFPLLYPLSA